MAGWTDDWLADTRTSYDTVATDYADLVRDAVADQLHLRTALRLLAEQVRALGGGLVADIGCGPGQFTAYLRELGVDAFGVDLSPAMVELARRDHPGLRFEIGSMTDPDLLDRPLAGVLAAWSLIHVPDEEVPAVLGHFHRALRPGGVLQVGFHAGDEVRRKTEGYGGHPMRVDVHRRTPERMTGWLRAAGFDIEAQWLLNPDAPSRQAILFARRPDDQSGPKT
ncbi:MAG TPA: class I SAM-dependent methyltransferase [Pseudonocardiaceae bacterium]|jgi:SAM-dependent methyltransferase|nr:class I SAM-dependent methyltransferase [Pseudonocardiaceae bacterium]